MQLHIFLRANFKLIFCCQWKIFNFSYNRHECVANVDITGNDDRFESHATSRLRVGDALLADLLKENLIMLFEGEDLLLFDSLGPVHVAFFFRSA